MTALEQYSRLEATGLWREAPDAQRRDVLVSLGDATLMISTLSEVALAHWSLPAVARLNPGRRPALYSPGADTEERLEIDDPDMITAIETVRAAIDRKRPHPGRLRFWIGAGLAAAMLGLAVFWLPGALTRQTVALLPEASRAEIGTRLLQEIGRLAGPICTQHRRLHRAERGWRGATFGEGRATGGAAALCFRGARERWPWPGGILVANAGLVEESRDARGSGGLPAGRGCAPGPRPTPMLTLLTEAGLGATFTPSDHRPYRARPAGTPMPASLLSRGHRRGVAGHAAC